jgi:thiazole synthase
MLTASLRRQTGGGGETSQSFWNLLRESKVQVLPNTAGCHSLQEAITTAEMAREVFSTDWIKLELIGDDYTLQPDTLNLPEAASHLIKAGFKVLPYCTEDLVLCQRLVDVGCQAVMPWAAPIGTGKGPVNPTALRTLRERLSVPLIVDAGLGLPSHACQVMEWGYDAVLLNTAVALAQDPVAMASAFALSVKAGRLAYLAGAMQAQDAAQPSTPVLGTPFWHHQ